ncbi:glycosyltransferase [uncultured Cetobacterium sp.]|uniref:glycosyltransferase n=1 Tax=uncultured Cetobacterium sp. TaxID=527638 RepID=UPI0025FE637D|nr:glycosyltransferase [uncultured Cetobacterium sp.]
MAKVAIIHDWLVNYGGAERVVEAFLEIYPDADIYTLVYDEQKMGGIFKKEKVKTTFIQKIPKATKIYTKLLPLMPYAFEELDLSGYDLVISSSSCCSKGVITGPNTKHIAYIHSPMRYAWDLYHDYKKRSGKSTKLFMSMFMKSLREWDYTSSQRIDVLIANSNYVAKRINKFWSRECKVIYPPVDIDRLSPNGKEPEDFYVVFSRFVPYKRIDLAIEACKKLNRKLVVIGDGEQREYLKSLADNNITFTGRISDEEVKDYLQRCKAMIFSAEEDFGIVPLEAQACGRPVIAYGKGGALETVVDGVTGVFFKEQEANSVISAIEKFETLNLNTEQIYNHAMKFSRERFKNEINKIIKGKEKL